MANLTSWWSSLTIYNKERIANKAVEHKLIDWEGTTHYPNCTRLWHSLSESQQQAIYDHCTDRHGHVLSEWREGTSMSY